ncbi:MULTISPECIES: Rv1733c family protein [unclassified Streptomyces]|uniref:Rv1733c family protein n=1 Tax=unclassified Streptomyces TaxID=2593676 RepID=UPI00403C6CAE
MRKTKRVKVLGWRWRHNELRRRSDVVEAWIVLAVWAVATAVGAVAGVAGAQAVETGQARSGAEHRPATAVLLGTVPRGARAPATYNRVRATVRWTDEQGTVRTATADVKAGTAVGSAVPVWTDGHGHLVDQPASPAVQTARVVMIGTGAGLAGGLFVLAGGGLIRLRVERRATERWGEEWERTGERWGRRTG